MPEHDDSAQLPPASARLAADPDVATPPARRSRARTPETTPDAEQPSRASRRRTGAAALTAAAPPKSTDEPLSTNRDALETSGETPRAGAGGGSARRSTTAAAVAAAEGSPNGVGAPATSASPAAAGAPLAKPAPRARARGAAATATGKPVKASAEPAGEPAPASPTRGRRVARVAAVTRDEGPRGDAVAAGERPVAAHRLVGWPGGRGRRARGARRGVRESAESRPTRGASAPWRLPRSRPGSGRLDGAQPPPPAQMRTLALMAHGRPRRTAGRFPTP